MDRIVRYAATAALSLSLCPALAAAAPAGALDPTFAIGGKRTLGLPNGENVGYPKMLRDSAGRIYLIAAQGNGPPGEEWIQVTRLHHDGLVDTSYGSGGNAFQAMPEWFSGYLAAVARQSDGKMLLGFGDYGPGICRISMAGALDTTFGDVATPGCIGTGNPHRNIRAIVVQPDGKIVVGGNEWVDQHPEHAFAARLMPDGSLDEMFGDNGVFELGEDSSSTVEAVALAPNGDILVAGDIFSNSDMMVLRLGAEDGMPVASFGTWGLAIGAFDAGLGDHDHAFAIAVLPDGGIVAAGYAQTNLKGWERPAVLKLTAAGLPDESFGAGGKRIYDPCAAYPDIECHSYPTAIAGLSGERIVLAGFAKSASGNYGFLALRILANGEGDASFGNEPAAPGKAAVAFDPYEDDTSWAVAESLSIEGERILLAGSAMVGAGIGETRRDFALARLDHGFAGSFTVTPKPGPHGTLSPGPQQVGHSNRAEFVVLPESGYVVDQIEQGPGYCDGGIDGDMFVSAPVVQACEVHVSFKRLRVFADGYE